MGLTDFVWVSVTISLTLASGSPAGAASPEEGLGFWRQQGFQEILEELRLQDAGPNNRVAKNVILFVGDGMSHTTVTAARIYKGNKAKDPFPESRYLAFERFPHMGHLKTYCSDQQTPDSASSASAMFSGVKTKYETLGFDSERVVKGDVASMLAATEVDTFMTWAQAAGMSTGVVTTTRLTHATPAAAFAHVADRNWESYIPRDVARYNEGRDVAWQLVNNSPGNGLKVAMGGGYPAFLPKPAGLAMDFTTQALEDADDLDDWNQYRMDGQDLIARWLRRGTKAGRRRSVVRSAAELRSLDTGDTEFLLGLFDNTHLPYVDQRSPEQHPSLPEMVRKAIEVLTSHGNESAGFLLLVEAGRIDQAHHKGYANRALEETLELEAAVQAALEMVSTNDTLVIVTADHSHTMSISGNANRGAAINGLAGERLDDGPPFTILTYANGPGFFSNMQVVTTGTTKGRRNRGSSCNATRRWDLSPVETASPGFQFASAGYEESANHGGDDVPVYAVGPMAHLFSRTHEQTHVANVVAYAACIGPYRTLVSGQRCCSPPSHLRRRAAVHD